MGLKNGTAVDTSGGSFGSRVKCNNALKKTYVAATPPIADARVECRAAKLARALSVTLEPLEPLLVVFVPGTRPT